MYSCLCEARLTAGLSAELRYRSSLFSNIAGDERWLESTSPAELYEALWTEAGRLLHECVVNASNKGSDDDDGIAPTYDDIYEQLKQLK